MRRVKRNILMVTLLAILTFTGCSGDRVASAIIPSASAEAKEAKEPMGTPTNAGCTVGKAEKYVANQLNLTVNGSGYEAYHDALVAAQILLPTELTDTEKSINKGELALLASCIMTYKGEKEDTDLSEIIISKKRISDLSKIDEPYKHCVVQVFGKGVMVGNSNGTYSQDRKFNASETVTAGAMKSAILKALGEKDRSVMSPDGQLTRTTKLPKNYKKYEYILASFPNKFYEQRFSYQYHIYYFKPENLKDYAAPVDIKNRSKKYNSTVINDDNIERWSNTIEQNLNYRFNFNYKTADNEWINSLRNTYYVFRYDDRLNETATNYIKDYVKVAKKNHVDVESSKIVVEPSTLYCDGGDYIFRCYVKFRLNSADEIPAYDSGEQWRILYAENGTFLKNLKVGQWMERYFDIAVSTSAYNDDGSGYAVGCDQLIDREKLNLDNYKGKTVWTLY